ncbi:malate dehydrogenase [Candidatus Bathyarchaeota archaeon]|nr:MAG: malate dehydrogenase [Candidatus Bathyarchaeota archaeon]
MKKATVIGVGSLGSCIAYELAARGIVDQIVLIDIYRELAEGNAEDISQAMAFRNNVEVIPGSYDDADESEVIIVTAGKPRTPDMKSRMDLLNVNLRIIKSVASSIKGIRGEPVVVTLTNPVDIMNYVMWRHTGFERNRIIGSAGMLDSARFRKALSRRLAVPVLDIEAYVLGEHGDNQTPLFSRVKVKGKKRTFSIEERREITEEIRRSALNVISKKGGTVYAPASNTVNMIQMIIEDSSSLAVSSVVLNGEYGLRDISIGVPVELGRGGVKRILEWELDEDEKATFYRGAENLRRTIKTLMRS